MSDQSHTPGIVIAVPEQGASSDGIARLLGNVGAVQLNKGRSLLVLKVPEGEEQRCIDALNADPLIKEAKLDVSHQAALDRGASDRKEQ